VDSHFSHGAWAWSLGGVSLPLLADFHPKGELARSLGLFLDEAGITDRATVVIDADGVVRHTLSVGPGGRRDMEELAAFCEELDAEYAGDLPSPAATPEGLPAGAALYVKDNCMFSRWALAARTNLHLEDSLAVVNLSQDPEAGAHLETLGGKAQVPALVCGEDVLYESGDIIELLVGRTTTLV